MAKRKFRISASWLCAIVGVLALLYMVFGSHIRGEFKQRSFEFNPGITHLALDGHDSSIVQGPTTWMLLVSSEKQQISAIVIVPYAIVNTGDRDLKNVALQLTYPAKHALSRDMLKPFVRPREEKYWKTRKVTRFAGRAVVRYETPLIHLGENSVFFDPILLPYPVDGDASQGSGDADPDTALQRSLAKHLPLLGYVNVHESVMAEDMEPLTRALNIVWISKSDRDIDTAWLEGLEGIYSAVWSGRKGPDLIFENPMSDLVVFGGGFKTKPGRDSEVPSGASFHLERVEMVELDLFPASLESGLPVLVERAGASYRLPSEMPMPKPEAVD